MLHSPLKFSHNLLKEYTQAGDTVIDATAGNGNDTVLLASLVGLSGKVHAFDIQKKAIEETKKKLLLTGLSQQVELHQKGHERMKETIGETEKAAAVVFNLGYLPKGDKSIVTLPPTTLEAVNQSLGLLRRGGILLIMVYHGHEGGKEEKNAVLQLAHSLSQQDYDVLKYEFINQKNNPPFLIAIEKK